MFLTDRVSVGKPRKTGDGYLVADAKVARTGIQLYRGAELGRPDLDTVRVYRPEEEVFSRDSLASYAYKPATNDHPSKMVDASTWKATSIGNIGQEVVRDGDHVSVPLVLMDAKAISDYEAGKREVSMGYSAEIIFDTGMTETGEEYDAIQRNIRINHIALVARGRAGSARIGDGRSPDAKDRADNPLRKPTMSDNTRTVMVDGLPVETTDAGAIAIDKLQKALAVADADKDKQIAAKEAQIDKLQAEIDDLKAKEMKDSDIDARVQARADLLTDAKSVNEADYRGKSDAEVRKAAVIAKLGDSVVTGKSDAYIEARFDMLVEDAKADPVTKALKDGSGGPTLVVDNGYAAFVADFNRKKEA